MLNYDLLQFTEIKKVNKRKSENEKNMRVSASDVVSRSGFIM